MVGTSQGERPVSSVQPRCSACGAESRHVLRNTWGAMVRVLPGGLGAVWTGGRAPGSSAPGVWRGEEKGMEVKGVAGKAAGMGE